MPSLRLGIVAIALAVTLASTALAHPAELAPEQYTRFLSDCSDDWGGHSAARDGHDLVALDVTERWLHESKEPAIFVRLTVGFGFAEVGSQRPQLRDEITMGLASGPVKVRLTSSDNQAFRAEAAPGFLVPDVMYPAAPSLLSNGTRDGSRLVLEYGFRFSSLGLEVGEKLLTFRVQAFAANEPGDYMPGGYYLAGVESADCPYAGSHGGQYSDILYVRRDYQLRGTEKPYFEVVLGTDRLVSVGNQTVTLPVTISNKLSKQGQTATVAPVPPSGWSVVGDAASTRVVPAQDDATFEVQLRPDVGAANGTLLLLVDSTVGGHGERTVDLVWSALPLPTDAPSGDAPGLATGAIAAAVAATVLLFRRVRT